MTESMASEPAEPTTRPQDDRVGTVRRLGNSWFVKLVEPASEPWHVVCSDGQQDVSGWQDDEDMEDCPVVGYLPVAECVPGLLADPAQTTELEDRAELADQLASANEHIEEQDARISQLEAEVVKQRIIAKNATDHWRQSSILASLRAANAQRGLELRKLNLAMARKNRVIAKRESERDLALWLHAEAAWRVAGFDVLTVALARRNHQLTAERDERQARLDRLTRWCDEKEADTRQWSEKHNPECECEVAPTTLDVIAEVRAALPGDQPSTKHCQYQVLPGAEPEENGLCIQPATDGEFCGTHAARLSGEALRAVEEADDAAEPACECFVVPEEQWTRHYDATEPGSMVEQNPDCPVHPAKQADDAAGDLP